MKKMMLMISAAMIVLIAATCSHEKEIQVTPKIWVLTKKIPASRHSNENVNHDYIWLVWETKEGDKYYERIPDFKSNLFPIGREIINRDRR